MKDCRQIKTATPCARFHDIASLLSAPRQATRCGDVARPSHIAVMKIAIAAWGIESTPPITKAGRQTSNAFPAAAVMHLIFRKFSKKSLQAISLYPKEFARLVNLREFLL